MKTFFYLIAILASVVGYSGAHAAIVTSEDFVAIDDWTFLNDIDGNGGLLTTSAIGSNTFVHEAVGADGGDNEGSLTRTFNTVGFEDITLDFSVFQRVPGTYEGDEFFDIQYDTGAGFTSLLPGGSPISALFSTGAAGTATAADVINLTDAILGVDAADGSFDLRLSFNTGFWSGNNGGSEAYILSNLVVNGTAVSVPEPSSAAIVGLCGLAGFARRRRKAA